MAIFSQGPGPVSHQRPMQYSDPSSTGSAFNPKFHEKTNSLDDPKKALDNFSNAIHLKYKDVNTTNIEQVVLKAMKNSRFLSNLINITSNDTLFTEKKTPLGEVLKEWDTLLENPGRRISLDKKTIIKAEQEANKILSQKPNSNNINSHDHHKHHAHPKPGVAKELQMNAEKFYWQTYIETPSSTSSEKISIEKDDSENPAREDFSYFSRIYDWILNIFQNQ